MDLTRRTMIATTAFTPMVLAPPWVAPGKTRMVHWQTWAPGAPRPEEVYASGMCSQKRFTGEMVGFLMATYGDCYVARITLAAPSLPQPSNG